MTSARLLQYKTFLLEQEDLELRSREGFNLTSCLADPKGGDLEEIHDYIQVIDLQT